MTPDELDAIMRRLLKPAQKPKDAERFRNALAFILVASFIGSLPLLIWKTIPEGNKEIITYILGQISGMALTVVGYYFVSKLGEGALETQRAENTQAGFKAIQSSVEAIRAAQPAAADGAIREGDEVTLEKRP